MMSVEEYTRAVLSSSVRSSASNSVQRQVRAHPLFLCEQPTIFSSAPVRDLSTGSLGDFAECPWLVRIKSVCSRQRLDQQLPGHNQRKWRKIFGQRGSGQMQPAGGSERVVTTNADRDGASARRRLGPPPPQQAGALR